MGKPYAQELKSLRSTYEWALTVPIDTLIDSISQTATTSLLSVGSGGSYTAAHFAAELHGEYTGQVSRSLTPLEVISSRQNLRPHSCMVLSAGGRNPDIISALKHLIQLEPYNLAVVGSNAKSPLSKLASQYRFVKSTNIAFPFIKDGFLGTNSLLAFSVFLMRGYAQAFSQNAILPSTLEDLVHPGVTIDNFINQIEKKCLPSLNRRYLIVLYGPSTRSAAIDLESKFSEAALAATLPSDFRNFAHGRHFWLARHSNETGLLAFQTVEDKEIANKTFQHIPKEIPVASLETPYVGQLANLAALVQSMYVVGIAGQVKDIDPGCPKVPDFGRKIYHLQVLGKMTKVSTTEETAIQRKIKSSFSGLPGQVKEMENWRVAHREFRQRIKEVPFRHIVFDYDGTLCEGDERYQGINASIQAAIERLLERRIKIGIATGRGKSVKKDLRQKFNPCFWPHITVGYYNGAEIGSLYNDGFPCVSNEPLPELSYIAELIKENQSLANICTITIKRWQLTVEPHTTTLISKVWAVVLDIVNRMNPLSVQILRSSHSVDILPAQVSKRSVVKQLTIGEPSSPPVLCIGDKGQYPGNDYQLLQEPYSLSVDEVSGDPLTCWNLAPSGFKGVQATEYYLDLLVHSTHGVRFNAKKL